MPNRPLFSNRCRQGILINIYQSKVTSAIDAIHVRQIRVWLEKHLALTLGATNLHVFFERMGRRFTRHSLDFSKFSTFSKATTGRLFALTKSRGAQPSLIFQNQFGKQAKQLIGLAV